MSVFLQGQVSSEVPVIVPERRDFQSSNYKPINRNRWYVYVYMRVCATNKKYNEKFVKLHKLRENFIFLTFLIKS